MRHAFMLCMLIYLAKDESSVWLDAVDRRTAQIIDTQRVAVNYYTQSSSMAFVLLALLPALK